MARLRHCRATASTNCAPSDFLVPPERIELPTFGLQNRCSTAELNRLIHGWNMAASENRFAFFGVMLAANSYQRRCFGTRLPREPVVNFQNVIAICRI